MNVEDVKTYLQIGGCGIALLLTIVQVTPIKINPWNWIAKQIGDALFSNVSKQINEQAHEIKALGEKVDQLDEERLKDKADTVRTRVLRFSDEIRRGICHSEESFNQTLDDITWYENYCNEHPKYKNRRATAAIALIISTHANCMDKNTFL